MKKKVIKRILLAVLAVVMLLGVLTACGGESAPTADSVDTPIDKESVEERANYLAKVLVLNSKAEAWFVAASRGYDMLEEGFDDKALEGINGNKDLPAVDLGYVNMGAARKVLQQEGVAPADTNKRAYFERIYSENMTDGNEAFVRSVVKYMATYVNYEDEPNNPMVWIGMFLKVLTNLTGGYYVLALFFFAIIVEILMLYFSIKQQKNSIKQAKMSPKERAIRKRYAGRTDQVSMRKMQEEIQKLYQEEGFNPMGG
ncbi:MAG: YidC/Oxa1 family membrane protein insertase, partial [Clostridia bacterium]|nr:YidC/Oxa1 family membrane protein insertase [Clostridia bacterium]